MKTTALLLSLCLLCTTAATAASKTPTLARATYDALQAAQSQIDGGKSGTAAAALRTLLATLDASPYEQAIVLQTLAQAELMRDAPVVALRELERALALAVLDDKARLDLLNNLAQVAMLAQRYERAVVHISAWIAAAPAPRAEAYVLLGSAQLQLGRAHKAIAPLQKAIALAKPAQESWYQALLGAYHETKDYGRCAELLYRMVRLFPQRDAYWRQLVGIELTRDRQREALAVMELAYLRNALNSSQDLVTLAQLRAQQDAPYKAAQLMEDEIAAGRIPGTALHWEFVANAWYQARESTRSVAALQRAVAGKGVRPDLQLRLAQLYVEGERWDEAAGMLQRVLDQASLKASDRGRGWLLMGIARYGKRAFDAARDAFAEAAKAEPVRSDAEQWLAYLDAVG